VIPTELPFVAPGMVSVKDNEHPWTRAYLAVFDHPYFAVTGNGGTFTIDGVPAGSTNSTRGTNELACRCRMSTLWITRRRKFLLS
jgi:hypothetical protein